MSVVLLFTVFCGAAHAEGSFGVSSFATSVSSSQAGGHPDFTTSFAFDTGADGATSGQIKDIHVDLPVGVVADPQATPRCTPVELSAFDCEPSAQIGIVRTRFAFPNEEPFEEQTPLYNVVPSGGHPATFATTLALVPILIEGGLRRDGSYGLEATVSDLSTLIPLQSSSLTLWGVPADPSHDAQRAGPPPGYATPTAAGISAAPLVINSSDCSDGPIESSLSADSWQDPGVFATRAASMPAPTGCDLLEASPTVAVTPETTQAASPSGYEVDVRMPQQLGAYALATPDLRNVTVTLPAGTVVSPSAANGLEACSEAQIGLGSGSPASCPDASKVGSLEIVTPLLGAALKGSVYVAQQSVNPFGSLLALYLVAEGEGVQVKLAGQVTPDPQTGQLTTTFSNNPQVPFSDLKLDLFGGPGAALSNPTTCGEARTASQLTLYSSAAVLEPSSVFDVTGCSAPQFSPAFSAGTANNQADAFSPFSVTISRSDQDQALAGVEVKAPPGLLGVLSNVPLCGEAQASAGTCSAASQIGHATVVAGAGSTPVVVPRAGQPQAPVYLTAGYKGAPFGLSVVVPAVAGPFNLGTVVVRAALGVDPHTGQIAITSDPLPTILDGIPLQLKTVNVTVDRPGFMFNPTSCQGQGVTGVITSTASASASVSSPFQAADCAALPFKPRLSASAAGRASKARGASLDVKIVSNGGPRAGGGEANIKSVKVDLPKQLPSRLTTLQKACLASVFEADPANCSSASNVGMAAAVTPVLAHPLMGPAYLVSHGGEAFPDLEIVLQGEGVTLILDGNTNIKKGITSSTFRTVPDAPITSFELRLPTGTYSVLGTNLPQALKYNLCGQALSMPTAITGQNGAVIKQATAIAITGCTKTKTKRKVTSAKRHGNTKQGRTKNGEGKR